MQCGRTSSALAVHVSVHKELEAAAGPLGSSSTSSLLLESGDDVGGFLGAGLSAGFAFLCRLLRALLRLLPRWRSSAGSSVPRRIGATGAGPANVEALGPAGLSPGGFSGSGGRCDLLVFRPSLRRSGDDMAGQLFAAGPVLHNQDLRRNIPAK